jgi:hypothetical protein
MWQQLGRMDSNMESHLLCDNSCAASASEHASIHPLNSYGSAYLYERSAPYILIFLGASEGSRMFTGPCSSSAISIGVQQFQQFRHPGSTGVGTVPLLVLDVCTRGRLGEGATNYPWVQVPGAPPLDLEEERRVALTSADAFRQEIMAEMQTSDGENFMDEDGAKKVETEVSRLMSYNAAMYILRSAAVAAETNVPPVTVIHYGCGISKGLVGM